MQRRRAHHAHAFVLHGHRARAHLAACGSSQSSSRLRHAGSTLLTHATPFSSSISHCSSQIERSFSSHDMPLRTAAPTANGKMKGDVAIEATMRAALRLSAAVDVRRSSVMRATTLGGGCHPLLRSRSVMSRRLTPIAPMLMTMRMRRRQRTIVGAPAGTRAAPSPPVSRTRAPIGESSMPCRHRGGSGPRPEPCHSLPS